MQFLITVANSSHYQFAEAICTMMANAAKVRGTGIAKRTPDYIQQKMEEGKAIIAITDDIVVGFCYIESWEGRKYVANSGLIVHPDYRKTGLAKRIKKATFDLSKKKFPNAKLFGITTSLSVMKINSDLGYKPVTFSELTKDENFWKGCMSCTNYDILQRTDRSMCICTGMICDLSNVPEKNVAKNERKMWGKFTRFVALQKIKIKKKAKLYPKLNKIINNEK
ncbi:MAG: GNAT family N-acetyltransferase [Cyclobacteriaceae bacterium]|nr:GNAT family N-acetyltransferase [Cyclobacteriaceae bacterium]